MPILLQDTRSPRCSTHPKSASGWRCTACRKWLCEACAVEKVVPPARFVACGACGEHAEEVRVRRKSSSFGELLRDVVRYPFSDSAKPYLTTLAVVSGLGLMWWPGRLAGMVLLATVMFTAVRASGRGERSMPGHFEFFDFFSLLREGIAAALPFLLWFGVVSVADRLTEEGSGPARFGVLLVATLAGACWAAPAFVYVAVGTSLLNVVNPLSALNLWSKAGRDLLPATALFAGTSVAWFGLQVLGDVIVDRTHVWVFPHLMLEPVRIYFALAAARAVGVMLYVHGGDAGYGTQAEWYDPALGKVLPTRTVEVQLESDKDDARLKEVEPIELDDTPLVPQPFETFQPTDPGASIDLPEGVEVRAARVVDDDSFRREAFPEATTTRATTATATEDLMDEEEFLRSVGAVPDAEGGRKAE